MGNPNQMDLDLYKTNRQDQRRCEGRLVSIFSSDSISELSAISGFEEETNCSSLLFINQK